MLPRPAAERLGRGPGRGGSAPWVLRGLGGQGLSVNWETGCLVSPQGLRGWGRVIQDCLCLPQPQPSCSGSCSLPPIPTLPGRLVSLPTATRLFGIDGGDLGDPGHLDHPFGVLPQLQVPQGRVQQVPDHLIVDLMGQVGRGRGQMLTGDQGQEVQAMARFSVPPESSRLLSGKPWLRRKTPSFLWGGHRGLQHPEGNMGLPEARVQRHQNHTEQAGQAPDGGWGLTHGRALFVARQPILDLHLLPPRRPPECILLAESTPRWLEQLLAALSRCPS